MAKTDKDFIRRGDLYKIIQNMVRIEEIPITYDNVKFLQTLVDKSLELNARWPDGRTMHQSIKLDSDLILKEAMIDSLERERTSEFKIKIIERLIEEMDKYDGRPCQWTTTP